MDSQVTRMMKKESKVKMSRTVPKQAMKSSDRDTVNGAEYLY